MGGWTQCEVHEFIDIKTNKWARHYKRKCKPMNSKKKKMSLKIVSSKKEKDIELCFHRLGLAMQALGLKKSTTFPHKTPMTKTRII